MKYLPTTPWPFATPSVSWDREAEQDAGVLDASKSEHVPAGVHVERVALQGAAGKRFNACAPLIQADIPHVRECKHANVVRLSQHI